MANIVADEKTVARDGGLVSVEAVPEGGLLRHAAPPSNPAAQNDDTPLPDTAAAPFFDPLDRVPPFLDIPGGVWTLFISLWGLIFFLFWCFFTGKPEATFMVVIACLFALMYFGVPLAMVRQAGPRRREPSNVVQTFTGPLSVNSAALQILIIPSAMVVGLTGFILLALP